MTTLLTMKGFNKQVTPWIYHNPSLWLISLSSDWSNWITIADKNLGATTVYNDGDTLSEANCWKYYQRWNNYSFPFTWAVTTSSSQVDASNYWPWNYYSSSTFIIRSNWDDWSSVQNDNLRGNTTDTLVARQWPCDANYHIPTNSELTDIKTILTTLWLDTSNGVVWKTYLKMPFAWQIHYSTWSSSWYAGNFWRYWGSSVNNNNADYVFISSIAFTPGSYSTRAFGFSIRPFKNTPVQPDDSRTVLYPTN